MRDARAAAHRGAQLFEDLERVREIPASLVTVAAGLRQLGLRDERFGQIVARADVAQDSDATSR
jgi:hypothetical protein